MNQKENKTYLFLTRVEGRSVAHGEERWSAVSAPEKHGGRTLVTVIVCCLALAIAGMLWSQNQAPEVPNGDKAVHQSSAGTASAETTQPASRRLVEVGSCGENAVWTLYDEGTLDITGGGPMWDYGMENFAPWYDLRDQIKSVRVEDGITSIGCYAFYGCSKLEKIVIPKGVSQIGEFAFYSCAALQSAEIPEGVTYLGRGMFYECKNLQKVTIPESVAEISWSAFEGCNRLTSVTVSQACIVSEYAFPETVQIKRYGVVLSGSCGPNAVYTLTWDGILAISGQGKLWDYTFFNENKPAPWMEKVKLIQSIRIEEGITWIGEYAFADCMYATEVSLPDSLEWIGKRAFLGCSGLKEIQLPDGLEYIQEEAFDLCTSLESVAIPGGVGRIQEGAFRSCENLKQVTIPADVTSIADYAFWGCDQLSSVTVGEKCRVSPHAFPEGVEIKRYS